MTNDKELLELAAKAAGIRLEWGGETWMPPHQHWNPLTDDGDALRLAVKLRIDISFDGFDEDSVLAVHTTEWKQEAYGDDPYAATRRAIVRAAAEIGRGME